MAHELLIEDGHASMMYVGQKPWHGLGTQLDHPPTAEEAIRAARLDWEVRTIPLHAVAEGVSREVRGQFAIVPYNRWKGPNCPIFGTVTSRYHPLQNRDAFRFFDPIISEGTAFYETAGALGKGERVWVLAKLPGNLTIADGDTAERYLLLSNSHSGKSSVQIKFTPVRVVCNNTLVMALKSAGESVSVAHTKDMKAGLERAQRNIKAINERYATIEKHFREMVRVKLDKARLTKYLTLVFKNPTDPEDERAVERVRQQRHRAAFLFESGRGNKLRAVAGTLWAAYKGVAEMMDHDPSKRDSNKQLNFIWYGDGARVKVRAFNVAKEQMETEWRSGKWWR